MRLLHTSDWHAGRIWKGVSRLEELSEVLAEMALFVEEERIDVVLVSGDLFDSGSPSPEAEQLVFEFLKRIGTHGVQSVLIAGNHDSPRRLDAWSTLAELVGVHSVTRPRLASEGGLVELRVGEELARIAAVPFAAPRRFVSAMEMSEEEDTGHRKYDAAMRRFIAQLSAGFDDDSVNIVMAHTHLEGAVISGSERIVHVGVEWASSAEAFPATADYVALGHIHKPQTVRSPIACEYAGSPLQMDFGEEGETKSFVLVEVSPRSSSETPIRVERIPHAGGRTLKTVDATLDLLERRASLFAASAQEHWLRVRVRGDALDPSVNQRVRRILPTAVTVVTDRPRPDGSSRLADRDPKASPVELYRRFYEHTHRRSPDSGELEAFDELHRAARHQDSDS